MTRVKICGIMREQDCDTLNELMPDCTGFIFAKDRRRYISPETAQKFKERLDKRIKTFGVFVDEDIDEIVRIAGTGILDVIQLHGSESDDTVCRVKDRTGLTVIKAFKIDGAQAVNDAMNSSADYLLLDNGAGGTGEKFDHELLEDVDRLYYLAGGLTPENVSAAIERYCPYGVDVSSGVETDGQKDHSKIKKFIETVRSF